MKTTIDSVTPVLSLNESANVVAASVAAIEANAVSVPAPRASHAPVRGNPAVSLLETVRALDGSKEQRYYLAEQALLSAYSCALKHGNKTQLSDVLASTGKKACERAMRTAIQTVGVPGFHKDANTREQAIALAVQQALDIFAAIACKPAVAKPVKAQEETTAPAPDSFRALNEATATTQVQATAQAAAPVLTPDAVLAFAAAQDDAALSALVDSLLALVDSRIHPVLKAA